MEWRTESSVERRCLFDDVDGLECGVEIRRPAGRATGIGTAAFEVSTTLRVIAALIPTSRAGAEDRRGRRTHSGFRAGPAGESRRVTGRGAVRVARRTERAAFQWVRTLGVSKWAPIDRTGGGRFKRCQARGRTGSGSLGWVDAQRRASGPVGDGSCLAGDPRDAVEVNHDQNGQAFA